MDNISASTMRTLLATSFQIYVGKNRLNEILNQLQPGLVAERRHGNLNRRTYTSMVSSWKVVTQWLSMAKYEAFTSAHFDFQGPNYIWHIDGYDKLSPYGLPIHGCVDGWILMMLSRCISKYTSVNDKEQINDYMLCKPLKLLFKYIRVRWELTDGIDVNNGRSLYNFYELFLFFFFWIGNSGVPVFCFRFSRVVIWLKVAPTNRQPQQTCHFFLEAVSAYGCPHTVRVDAGTENTNIRLAQDFLCADLPRTTALPTTLVGSSNHNEVRLYLWSNTNEPILHAYVTSHSLRLIWAGY